MKLKVTAKFDPADYRCGSGNEKKTCWCFKIRPSGVLKAGKKRESGHVVVYSLPSGQLIGFLGKECRMVYDRKDAHVFKGGAMRADVAAQKCILYARNPGGKDPAVIYRKADKK